jgi:hypothetical protein
LATPSRHSSARRIYSFWSILALGAFFAELLVAITPEEDIPLRTALNHSAFERGYLAADDSVDRIALLAHFRKNFPAVPQRYREIRDFDESFIAHPRNRFACEEKNSGFTQFHRVGIFRRARQSSEMACIDRSFH